MRLRRVLLLGDPLAQAVKRAVRRGSTWLASASAAFGAGVADARPRTARPAPTTAADWASIPLRISSSVCEVRSSNASSAPEKLASASLTLAGRGAPALSISARRVGQALARLRRSLSSASRARVGELR